MQHSGVVQTILRRRYSLTLLLMCFLGVLSVVPLKTESAQYIAPTSPPPGGSFGVPINLSSSVQTKEGTLNLPAGLRVNDTSGAGGNPDFMLTNPSPTAGDVVWCWNDTTGDRSQCKTGWNNVEGLPPGENFLKKDWTTRNYPGPENPWSLGWIDLTGVDASDPNPPALSAFDVTAPLPGTAKRCSHNVNIPCTTDFYCNQLQPGATCVSLSQSYAVQGLSSTIPFSEGTGVYAQANASSLTHAAVYGKTPNVSNPATTAWAGYFSGNVGVGSSTGSVAPDPFYYDLIVDSTGGSLDPNNNGIGELCLNGYCRSSWSSQGDLYWIENGTYLQARDAAWKFSVGSGDATSPFYYQNFPSQLSGDLVVNGPGSTSQTLTLTNQ